MRIYKFKEPELQKRTIDKLDYVTLILDYHHVDLPTDRADCETLFVDFSGDGVGGNRGDIYLVTKFPSAKHLQRVVKVPVEVHENLEIDTF